jgi:hypothetical protein
MIRFAQDVGALLLRSEPFTYLDSQITFSQETDISRNSALRSRNPAVNAAAQRVVRETTKPTGMFQPRPPKAGIGARKKANFTAASIPRKPVAVASETNNGGAAAATSAEASTSSAAPKGQDDFRRMLLEGKK